MATPVPAPVIDARNGDQVAASAIGAMPPELSDRSDANPAVVILEAAGYILDKLIFNLNNWPNAVVQKCLSLIGVTLNAAASASVTQTFSLSAPGQQDTTIPQGTQVSTSDGTIVFASQADLLVKAYTAPAGTIALTAGSATVTGSGTSFVTDGTWNGWQIQIQGGTWYTISSVASTTSLTLTASAASTASGAFYAGAVSGSVLVKAVLTGNATNVAAAKLATLVSSVNGVSSTTNNSAAAGGADVESITAAIARAALAFAARDVACDAASYAYFAAQVLGTGSRAVARGNYNVATATNGYVTVALLSPLWTSTTPISAQERAAVVRDLSGRSFIGSSTIDVAASIVSYTPAAAVFRKSTSDPVSTRVAVAGAVNTYLSPASYPWDPNRYTSPAVGGNASGQRPIYAADLIGIVEGVSAIDRVQVINGIPAVGASFQAAPASITFTNGSATATTTSTSGFVANSTFIVDAVNSAVYLVTSLVANTSVTFDRVWAGSSATSTPNYFNSTDTDLASWYTLPYSSLSTDPTAPPASIIVVGSV